MSSPKYFAIVVFLIIISSCKSEIIDSNTLSLEELNSSPDTVFIGDYTIGLDAYVWRNFQPSTEPNSSLRSVVTLKTENSQIIPENIVLINQYVINKDLFWKADFDEIRSFSQNEVEGFSFGGPEWETGIEVDVVCEFSFEGKEYRIIVRDQEIHRAI